MQVSQVSFQSQVAVPKLYRMKRVDQYVKGRLDERVFIVRATSEENAHEEMGQRFVNDECFTVMPA